jgi:hypothetical protein
VSLRRNESHTGHTKCTTYVPSMQNNLIPPFMMREAGIKVSDTPKIQVQNPTDSAHSIYFEETGFRIPMPLWGVVSYFQTSRPTELEMTETEEVYMLTPSRWDPHQSSYATNEENMLDWEGNMIERRERQQLLLSDIEESHAMAALVSIGSTEADNIDLVMDSFDDMNGHIHATNMYLGRLTKYQVYWQKYHQY